MSQIARSSGSGPLTATQVAAITGVVVQLPPDVSRSNLAMLLTGTVIGRDSHGLTLVQSGQGVLGLRLSAQPPTGTSLTLQVQSAGAQLHVAVVAANPPTRAAAAAPPPSAPIEATFLGPQPNLATEGGVSAGRAAAAPTSFPVRVLTQPSAVAPTASQLPAIVAGRAPNGHTLVDTPAGRFSLPLANPPPPGAKLVLQSTAAPFPTAPPSTAGESRSLATSSPATPAGSASQGLATTQAAQPATAKASVAAVVITQEAALPATPAALTLRSPSAFNPVAPDTDAQPSSRPSPVPAGLASGARAMLPTSLPSQTLPGPAAPQAGAVAVLATQDTAARQALVAGDLAAPQSAKLATPSGSPPTPATPRPSSPALSATPQVEAPPYHRAMLLPTVAAPSARAAGTPIMVRVVAADTPTHPSMAADARAASAPAARSSASSSAPAAPRQFTAIVTGSTPNGDTIVESPLGRITIALPKPPPAGQELALQLIAEERPPPPAASQPSLTSLSRDWPNLRAALDAREPVAAGTARPMLDALPQPGPRLAQQMLAFFTALGSGDVRPWLGDGAQSLDRAAGTGIIARLEADLAEMKTATAGNGDWRVAFLPFVDGSELQQIRIYSRRHKAGAKPEDDPGDRFLLEFEMTELGPLQVDGLLHKPRCDVILRSQTLLPSWLRSELVRLYADSISAIGLAGELSFQVTRNFPTPALDDAAAEGVGVVV